MKPNQQKNRTSFVTLASFFAVFAILVLGPGMARAQWNPNTSVNLLLSSFTDDVQLAAPTTDGKTWIAFYSQTSGNYAMRAQLLDANGYKLLGPDGIMVSNQPSGTATFVFNICLDAANNLIIAMQDLRSGMNAYLYKIDQSGNHLWSPNGVLLGGGLSPNPTVLTTGETIVCWDETASATLNLQKISVSGTTVWATPIQVKVGITRTTRGQIVANSGGKFTMLIQRRGVGINTTLWAQAFDNSGTALYSPVQLSTQGSSAARYYSILADADTTYFGYYVSPGSRFNSFLQRLNPGGTIPWGINGSNFNTAVGTTDNYQMVTDINMQPGSNYIYSVANMCNTLQSQYGIYVQKFLKTTGARQFTDAAKVVYPISTTRDQHIDRIAMITDGPMFMAYTDSDYKIYAVRLDASGNFVWPGNKVELSSTPTPSQPKMRFNFTPIGPNKCAGAWTENRGAAGYRGYAQGVSIGGLVAIKVATQNNVPVTITVNNATLQIVDTIFPLTSNQNVTWSIVPVSGAFATINANGLVTPLANGTVYAKAVSVQDATMKDSLLITISGQVPDPTTLPATNITLTNATVNGSVTPKNFNTFIYFYYGLTSNYTNVVAGSPFTLNGLTPSAVFANLTNLLPNTTYHYACNVTCTAGSFTGADMTFSTCATAGAAGPISGPGTVCQEQTAVAYSIAPIPNVSTYAWTVPTGATIVSGAGTQNITVNFAATAQSGNITVAGVTCTPGPSSTLPVSVVGIPNPIISGDNDVCVNSGYVSYATEPGMTNYQWNISPGGTIALGAGTYNIQVIWNSAGPGWVSVNYYNLGGCQAPSPFVLNVSVNPAPDPAGAINGSNSVCVGAQNVPYQANAIPNAQIYVWSLPANVTIASGTGTNSITVNFAANAASGTISVAGNNGCGNGAPSNLYVEVNAIPPIPVITSNGYELTSSAFTGNQWYHDGLAIAGATGQVYWVQIASPGWYWTVVTLNNCQSDTSNNIYIQGVGIGEKNDGSISIYPMPNSGKFNLSMNSSSETSYTIEILNSLGVIVYRDKTITVKGTTITPVDLGSVPAGLYTIILRNADNQIIRKMIVRQ